MILNPRTMEYSTQAGGRVGVWPAWWSKAACCSAPAGTSAAPSKAMLVTRGDFLRANGTGSLTISATLRIKRPPRDGFATLLDVEATNCWPDGYGPNPSPGVRLMLHGDWRLEIDRQKIGLRTIYLMLIRADARSRLSFKWRIERGRSRFGIDTYAGMLWVDDPGAMVPTVDAIRAATGIADFAFAREPVYNRIQIGITANASSSPVEVIVEKLAIEAHE